MKTISLTSVCSVLLGVYLFGNRTVDSVTFVGFQKSRDTCRNKGQRLGNTEQCSLTLCVLRCLMDRRCLSLSYHIGLTLCDIHDTCYMGCCSSDSDGWSVYYPLAKECPEILEDNPEDEFGKNTGGMFTDCDIWHNGNITAVTLGYISESIRRVKTKYGNIWSEERGSYGVDAYANLEFQSDEYITEVIGSGSNHLESVQIITNKKTYPRYGNQYGVTKSSKGKKLLFISGLCGGHIDKLVLHWLN